MLWVYLTLAIFLFSGVRAEDNEETAELNDRKLQKFVKDICLKYGSAEDFEKLDSTIKGFYECLGDKPSRAPTTEEELFNMKCVDSPPVAYGCIEELVNALEPCLHSEEKYLPNFVLETFNSTVEQVCQGGASGLKELIVEIDKSACISLPFTLPGLTRVCLPKLALWQEIENSDFVLTESDFCSDLHKAQECVVSSLKEVCPEEIITKYVDPAMETFGKWCNERESENQLE